MSVPTEDDHITELISQLSQEKQQLISLISHDLRSPFNRLHALLQLLQMNDANLTPDQKVYLEKMHIVVADALAMMRNLMDYRSLELNLFTLQPEELRTDELLNSVVKSFAQVARKKDIELKIQNNPHVRLFTDRNCLQRALENIVSNALKFSFGGKTVILNAGFSEPEYWLEISDEGQGFKKEELESIGQKFKKLSARPTGGESSTGLGLYIANTLIGKINGKISVKSVFSRGSTFRITLPVTAAG